MGEKKACSLPMTLPAHRAEEVKAPFNLEATNSRDLLQIFDMNQLLMYPIKSENEEWSDRLSSSSSSRPMVNALVCQPVCPCCSTLLLQREKTKRQGERELSRKYYYLTASDRAVILGESFFFLPSVRQPQKEKRKFASHPSSLLPPPRLVPR